MKCPVPRHGYKLPKLTDIWSKKMSTISKEMPTVAFTLPRPNQQWGQLENNEARVHPPINFKTPNKFVKAPNGCDVKLIEASTPEIDDVVRVEDDYGRT